MSEQWIVMMVAGLGRQRVIGRAAAADRRAAGEMIELYHREELAERSLTAAGYSAWAPMATRVVQRRRGALRDRVSEQVREPWMPGYLFVDAASGDGWAGLALHPLVTRPIRFGVEAAVISGRIVASLRAELEARAEAEIARDAAGLSIGDRVRIEIGALAGSEARVEEIREGAARLELPLCGGAPVWVPVDGCALSTNAA